MAQPAPQNALIFVHILKNVEELVTSVVKLPAPCIVATVLEVGQRAGIKKYVERMEYEVPPTYFDCIK